VWGLIASLFIGRLRTALQISDGDLGGLVTPLSVVVYLIVVLVLLWPLVRRLLPRRSAVPVLAEAAHEIEEAHSHHGLPDSVSVERGRGENQAGT
jgi:putative tricarboxylic transport membrane protein